MYITLKSRASTWLYHNFQIARSESFSSVNGVEEVVVFSKLNHRKSISLSVSPLIGATINTKAPCYGSNRDKLVLKHEQILSSSFYLEKEEPVYFCPYVNYKQNRSGDERYNSIGLITLYDLQSSNGIY